MISCIIRCHRTAAGLKYYTSDKQEEKDSVSHSYKLRYESNTCFEKTGRKSLLKYTFSKAENYGLKQLLYSY